jgi:hypothetical protein
MAPVPDTICLPQRRKNRASSLIHRGFLLRSIRNRIVALDYLLFGNEMPTMLIRGRRWIFARRFANNCACELRDESGFFSGSPIFRYFPELAAIVSVRHYGKTTHLAQ